MSGLTNMIRQLGGAVGVAVANILLAQKNPLHRLDLAGNISEYNTVAHERVNLITQGGNAVDLSSKIPEGARGNNRLLRFRRPLSF